MTARQTYAPSEAVTAWRRTVIEQVAGGGRLAGLYAAGDMDSCVLSAVIGRGREIRRISTPLSAQHGVLQYSSLTPQLPAADWYERAMQDLSGVVPRGHPRPEPLLLPRGDEAGPPLPGAGTVGVPLMPKERPGSFDVTGRGVFTVPYGPVRSGVFESVEYLVETPGEDIPHVTIRPYFKHRGVAKRFERTSIDDGVLVAERVEGIASVAHALAFSHAIEQLAGISVPAAGSLLRVIFAELERIANHLDVAMRLAEAAGLSAAVARFGWHKEMVMRLTSSLCGSRFGRGVVIPGGVRRGIHVDASRLATRVDQIAKALRPDVRALMVSASFLDRVRGTGLLQRDRAARFGALGPVGRASAVDNDVRRDRPYDGYPLLPAPLQAGVTSCDALGRLEVRWSEIDDAFRLLAAVARALPDVVDTRPNVTVREGVTGTALGSAEAPQGEVLYAVEVDGGRIRRCFARSASFHNLRLFQDVWHGDVKTDFAFIEASFGLSYAGVAM